MARQEDYQRMGAADVKALAQRAHSDSILRDSLFKGMLESDSVCVAMEGGKPHELRSTRSRVLPDERTSFTARIAAWTLTHLPPSDNVYIAVHRERLVQLAMTTVDVSLRRLSMALLERLEWGETDVRTDFLDFCLEHMMLAEEPYGVRSLCMKLAYKMCRHYPELREELHKLLLFIEPDRLGAGVRHTRGKLLKALNCR